MAVPDTQTILQLVLLNQTGDSYHRMRWPGSILAEQDRTLRIINLDARAEERFRWAEHADLLVLFQSADEDLFPILLERKRLGLKTIVEYNDNFYSPPASSPVSEAWSSPLVWQSYERFIQLADSLIVTGPGLKDLFSAQAAEKTIILENHLPNLPPSFDSLWNREKQGFHFGWAGSLGHIFDLISFAPTLQKMLHTDHNLHFHSMGNEAIPELLNLPKDRFHFTPWDSVDRYLRFWEDVQLGIILAADNPYNNCRSDIKAIEIASRGALPILPKSIPYQSLTDTGLFPTYRSLQELEELIVQFAKDPNLLKQKAELCYDYVINNRLGIKHFERLELYRNHLPHPKKLTNNFSWPLGTGYHEILGTPERRTRTSRYLDEIQNLLDQKQRYAAKILLKEAYQQNHYNSNFAYALHLLKQEEDAEYDYSQIQRDFPRDLRLRLLSKSDHTLEAFWDQCIVKLEGLTDQERSFFKKDLLKEYSKDLKAAPEIARFGSKVLTMYPDAFGALK